MGLNDQYEKFRNRGGNRLDDCGCSYEEIDVSAADYAPATPFRALHVGTAGDVVIKGLDGVAATLKLAAGTHALAGTAIVSSGTDAADLVVIR